MVLKKKGMYFKIAVFLITKKEQSLKYGVHVRYWDCCCERVGWALS